MHPLCKKYAEIMQKLCKIMQNYAKLCNVPGMHALCKNYAEIMQNYENYASLRKLCKLRIPHFVDVGESEQASGAWQNSGLAAAADRL